MTLVTQFLGGHADYVMEVGLIAFIAGIGVVTYCLYLGRERVPWTEFLGILGIIAGCLIAAAGFLSWEDMRYQGVEIQARADCAKLGAVPAEYLDTQSPKLYCVQLITMPQIKTGSLRRLGAFLNSPGDAFTKNCQALKGTVVLIPFFEYTQWGCGRVVATGVQVRGDTPVIFKKSEHM